MSQVEVRLLTYREDCEKGVVWSCEVWGVPSWVGQRLLLPEPGCLTEAYVVLFESSCHLRSHSRGRKRLQLTQALKVSCAAGRGWFSLRALQ